MLKIWLTRKEEQMNTNKLKAFGVDVKPTFLVLDVSNLLYRSFYANKDLDDITTAGLAHHQALALLNKYYRKYRPDKLFMTFDRPNWRKIYTLSDQCVSGRVYKGHRRQNMTPAEQAKYAKFCSHLKEFELLMTEHTSVICLASDGVNGRGLEADDLMAGVVQEYNTTHDIVIVSSDKDLMQLLRYDNVTLIDPATDEKRTLDKHDNNADFFMFEKCIRGDMGDNVGSALPRVRSTKIKLAFDDTYEREKMMHTTWKDQEGKEFQVQTLYNENKLLMDLSCQPDDIKALIKSTIENAIADPGKYSHFHFLRFCGKYDLKRVSDQVEQFVPMLSL